MHPRHIAPLLTALIVLLALAAAGLPVSAASGDDALPPTLADTGLFADARRQVLQADVIAFSPQYPLWSDGADKHRWLRLPPGTAIDARDPDAWVFPVGTQLWKTFAHAGRAVETRYVERRADGRWHYAVYLWNAEGTQATLAPARGTVLALPQAPGGRYEVPGRGDCLACHDSAVVPVLGFTALQLSTDRDPLAPHADLAGPVDLRGLVARGIVRGLPGRLLRQPPRIAADTPTERAALGYLHGNCGHCHNADGSPAPVGLRLAQSAGDAEGARQRVLASTLGVVGRFRLAGGPDTPLIAPGQPAHSLLVQRLRSRQANTQMPPLGSRVPDTEGIALVERWITNAAHPHPSPPTIR